MDNSQKNIAAIKMSLDFLASNYNYVWLKAMIGKNKLINKPNPTLITGSSHALWGFNEKAWENAINCSMISQDIYYDFLCAREAVRVGGIQFNKCYIVLGYYIAFQDLSRSTINRQGLISRVYYPLFGDSHNWNEPDKYDLWNGFSVRSDKIKEICEKMAVITMTEQKSFFSEIKRRTTVYDFGSKQWQDFSYEEHEAYGKKRAEMHNKLIKYTESYRENKEIFKNYMHFLHTVGITPIVVVTPFTEHYNRYVDPVMKEAFDNMLNDVPDEIHYINFNDMDEFDNSDFIDTDHLNAKGAEKVSCILTEIFGT